MIAKRFVNQLIDRRSEHGFRRILVFTGARQVGKTTLVKESLTDYEYLSIEDPVMRTAYAELTAQQWHSLYPQAALDEVQKMPRLIESIKSTYDQYPEVRYALLGSSQLLLLQKVKESLAGRCSIFTMYPLTLPEMLTAEDDSELFFSIWQQLLRGSTPALLPNFQLDKRMSRKMKVWQHYNAFGGYPALIDPQLADEDRYLWLANYVRTYLERDVRDLANFRDLEPYTKLQQIMALRTGQLLNASALATQTGISSKTVMRYIEYLNLSFQTLLLPPWDRNEGKRLVKSPKVHCLDQGVLQAILRKRGGMTAAEFESLVISELFKQAQCLQAPVSFYHLRTQDGAEVDLLVELSDGYYAFEIKLSEHVTKTDARHLIRLAEILDKPLIHGYLLSNDMETKQITNDITALHAAMFLT